MDQDSPARDFLQAMRRSKAYQSLLVALGGALGARECPPLAQVTGSALALLAGALHEDLGRPLCLVLQDDEDAASTANDLELFGKRPLFFPGGAEGRAVRTRVLREFQAQGTGLLVAPLRALLDPLPSGEALLAQEFVLRRGDQLSRDAFLDRLVQAGFQSEPLVDREKTFSLRGDILDIFPPGVARPLRLELFDDQVEDIRAFDPATQLTTQSLDELRADLETSEGIASREAFAKTIPAGALYLAREAKGLSSAYETHRASAEESERPFIEEAFAALCREPTLFASRLRLSGADAIDFGTQVIAPRGTSLDSALQTLDGIQSGKDRVLIAFDTAAERDRFLSEADKKRQESKRKKAALVPILGTISRGFHAPQLGIALCAHHELFATAIKRRPRIPGVDLEEETITRTIDSFLDLAVGDYVVHLTRGIGQFTGLETLEQAGARQDFLRIQFKDDMSLLVPASRIELVQKYIGGGGEAPELSKLGGSAWEKRKQAVERGITDLAVELLEIQAQRERKQGIQHQADTPWQHEFEAAFPYELTPDQAKAVLAIKADMESSRPMDRLLCGDVGYGKTEVAMRAAFKAVMGNRQVAVLVPTTILAEQHLQSFRRRMADYPVVIAGLSRFQSKSDVKLALEGLADGSVDIVIGTHRLVQADVHFKDLGLVVIDEEQRFGVAHKEKLRRLRRDVDVLTLSATPIPRTLHQSLIGIRDVSALHQAPRGRRAVVSEVVPRDDHLIQRAILRELDRGGQVFFVHNRVHSIDEVCARLKALVPSARFLVGHGQMGERELEDTMQAFIDRKADVLVATTIIESGLDIPSANTIFVDRADHYGLAELHQLRGRVGRQHVQAYAYFLVPEDRLLTEVSEKRLRAIEEFSRLGAGFQISMRDLEIRGAGNILGTEQSGHIAAIGYELYCRLLDRAVRRLRKEEVPDLEEAELDLDVTAFLPAGYIPDLSQRIELYRKLGRARSESDFAAVLDELRDRYGELPAVAHEFVLVAKIRALLGEAKVRRLEMHGNEGLMITPGRRMWPIAGLARNQIRPLSNGKILLVFPRPFAGPRELLMALSQAFSGGPSAAPTGPGGRAAVPAPAQAPHAKGQKRPLKPEGRR